MRKTDFIDASTGQDFAAGFEAVLSTIDSLPTLPAILWEIQAALQNPRSGSAEIAMVIEQDPSLTANILRLANSAYFHSSNRYLFIAEAVARIGLREIENMVSATFVIDIFTQIDKSADAIDFCFHSLQVAEAASFLTERSPKGTPFLASEAYIAGLLHDVGKLILREYFSGDFKRVSAYATQFSCGDAEAERQTLGVDHGEIGAVLLEIWNLDENLVEAVRRHHRVDSCSEEHRAHAETLRYADSLCHSHQQGEIADTEFEHPSLGLGSADAKSFIKNLDYANERAHLLLK